MRVILRPGGPTDAAALHAVYLDAVRNGTAPHYTVAEARAWAGDEAPRAWLPDRLARGRTWIAGPSARGFLTTTPEGDLDLFFVRAVERGGPVAPALYAAYARWLEERAITAPHVHASRLLRPFLERRGWQVLHRETVPRGGETLVRYRMQGPPCPGANNR